MSFLFDVRSGSRATVYRHVLLLSLLLSLSPLAQAVEKGQQFKDWTVGCEKLPGLSEERCFIYQTVVNKENEQPVLQMAVGYLPIDENEDQPAALLTLPLGVALPPGVGFQIDEGKLVRVKYERCLPTGCIAGFPLNDEMINQFKRGNKMEVRVHDGVRAVAMPISLSGFTAGFDALK